MGKNHQRNKIIKLFLIVMIVLIYYMMNGAYFNPFSIFLMLPIGFVFSYQTRHKQISYIDIVILAFLSLIVMMLLFPPLDFIGIFKQYMSPSSEIIGLIIFLLGYYLGYFITKENGS